jgi:hypothetical protein
MTRPAPGGAPRHAAAGAARPDRTGRPHSRAHTLVLRHADAGPLADLFLAAAVATVLLIRAFLAATGYPRLGGGHLHIAHMLWGGLGMAAALVLTLVSLAPRARWIAAAFGGVGFGFFIDELGKFITRDNDYFYQPTIAIVYLLFVVFYLAVRRRLSVGALDADERIANALLLAHEATVSDLDERERARALVRDFLRRLPVVRAPRPAWYERLAARATARTERVLAHPAFERVLAVVLAAQALGTLVFAVVTARALWRGWRAPETLGTHVDVGVMDLLQLGSSLVSAVVVGAGMARLLGERAAALRTFRLALLVSLFVTQVLAFHDEQLAGLPGLATNLALLAAVEWLLHRQARTPGAATGPHA